MKCVLSERVVGKCGDKWIDHWVSIAKPHKGDFLWMFSLIDLKFFLSFHECATITIPEMVRTID